MQACRKELIASVEIHETLDLPGESFMSTKETA
jgi:hypothetical protein